MRNLLIASNILICSCSAFAQEQKPVPRVDEIQWGAAPAVFPKGAQMSVLAGDPGKPGLFVLRLKMPAGYKIPAHRHSTTENVTVISGTFHGGMGDKLDESKGMELQTGGFISLPANMNHFAWATQDSIVEVASEGPFDMIYADPNDDPGKVR